MSSLNSLRFGLSKSYHSLTVSNENELWPDNDPAPNIPGSNTTPDFRDISISPDNSSAYPRVTIPISTNYRTSESFERSRFANGSGQPLKVFKSVLGRISSKSNKYRQKASSKGLVHSISSWAIPEGHEMAGNQFMGRLRDVSYTAMPSAVVTRVEQASPLLGSFGDSTDDFELRNVQLSLASPKTLTEDGSAGVKEEVKTPHGTVTIAVSGDRTKPVILTYHDLGLNHVSNFQNFLQFSEMRELMSSFCVVHVNAPGQEVGAETFPIDYAYPSMDDLAETVSCVRKHLGCRSFVGFGVGLGANVLARMALKSPEEVDALLLINGSSTTAGWTEWGYQKLNLRHLKSGKMSKMTIGTVDYLVWHHFGKSYECNQDLVTVYRQHFEKALNPVNLALLIESYIARTDLGIVRELDPNKKKECRMLRCPVLNMTSFYCPHVDSTVTLNSRLDPVNSTWMKIQDCGLVIDECPGKVVEAFRLFLQGQGYAVNARRSSLAQAASETNSSSASVMSGSASSSSSKDIRITENPLENPTV